MNTSLSKASVLIDPVPKTMKTDIRLALDRRDLLGNVSLGTIGSIPLNMNGVLGAKLISVYKVDGNELLTCGSVRSE